MLDEKEFINEVWNKYNGYSNNRKSTDKFFSKKIYKKSEYLLAIKSFITFSISLISTAGIVYAGITTYNFIQNSTSTNFNEYPGYDYNQNMTYANGIYYKKITSYEEYESAKNTWDNLVDMKQKDFKNYFMLIIAGENYNTTGLYISNIYTENSKLCVELKKKDVWNENDTVISTKIPKELDLEQIEIINLPNKVDTSNKYKNIDEITSDYSIDEALKENCFTINDRNQVISENKNQLNEFVENCNNKINDLIRICIFESNRTVICDIQYVNNKINMVDKVIRSDNFETNYYTGIGITSFRRRSLDGTGYCYNYNLYNELGSTILFCIVKE